MRSIVATVLVILLAASAFGEDYVDLVKRGNEAFKGQDYTKAKVLYDSAQIQLPVSPELEYNIAGTLYQQGKYEETVERYNRAMNTTDVAVGEGAMYNLGNTYYRMGEFDKAIAAYKNALNINPNDMDAKFNLELARRMLKENSQPEQNEQQDEQQQKQDKKEQPQDNQQQNEEQDQSQQQDQQEQQDQQQEQQAQQEEEKEMSKEDAERILNALRDDEKDLQKKVKRMTATGEYTGKDW